MITTNIEWHNPADELPVLKDKDEMVLVFTGVSVMSVYYSSKHKLFNAGDYDTYDEAKRTAIDPICWAYMPEFHKSKSEDE